MFLEMRFDLGTLDSGERSLPFGLLVFFLVVTHVTFKSNLSKLRWNVFFYFILHRVSAIYMQNRRFHSKRLIAAFSQKCLS